MNWWLVLEIGCGYALGTIIIRVVDAVLAVVAGRKATV
jgi:hypothetical protein